MTKQHSTDILGYDVQQCPKCGKPHHFKLKMRRHVKADEKVSMFGAAAGKSEVLLTCPDTGQTFTQIVPEPPIGQIIGVASEEDICQLVPASLKQVDNEFSEWMQNSRTMALEFCKTMLSTSAGAIPIYFAVLKYLGFDKVEHTALSNITILPPVLFLAGGILYVLALLPRYEEVSLDDFGGFRARRLKQLNQYMIWGTLAFAVGTCLSIVILFYSLK
jgi:hypothetical protein